MKMINYPKTGQFRNVIHDIQHEYSYKQVGDDWIFDPKLEAPTLKFTASVKLHGTNAAVIIDPNNDQYTQSRRNVLSLEKDNQGFCAWHNNTSVQSTFSGIRLALDFYQPIIKDKPVAIYGEWAGKGIAKGVSVNDLDKFFYIFGVKVVEEDEDFNWWLSDYPLLNAIDHRIYDAREFYDMELDIDFNNPQLSQNIIHDAVMKVEEECPVGLKLKTDDNIEHTYHIGEGLVFKHIDVYGKQYIFKAKGDKHQTSGCKTIASVDIEKLHSIMEFVEYAVTDNRCTQMYEENCTEPFTDNQIGVFIKAVSSDIMKEESDVLSGNGLCMRDVGSSLSKATRTWLFNKSR